MIRRDEETANAYLNRGGDTDGASVDVEDSGYKYIQYI